MVRCLTITVTKAGKVLATKGYFETIVAQAILKIVFYHNFIKKCAIFQFATNLLGPKHFRLL